VNLQNPGGGRFRTWLGAPSGVLGLHPQELAIRRTFTVRTTYYCPTMSLTRMHTSMHKPVSLSSLLHYITVITMVHWA